MDNLCIVPFKGKIKSNSNIAYDIAYLSCILNNSRDNDPLKLVFVGQLSISPVIPLNDLSFGQFQTRICLIDFQIKMDANVSF